MPIANTPITDSTPLEDLVSHAETEINNLLSGEEFIVKDLFLGYEWNRIYSGDRTRLGRDFFAFSKGIGATKITALDKTPQNQQRYKKL